MKFLKGLILECIGNASIHTTFEKYEMIDGSEHEKQIIRIKYDKDDLNKVIDLFKSMNIVFDYNVVKTTGISGKERKWYELGNFRRI